MLLLRWSVLLWVAIIPCAIANGVLRDQLLAPRWGMALARPFSGVLLAGAVAAAAWLLVRRAGPRPASTWLAVGAGWFAATLALETAMGLAAGHPWERILAPYRGVDNDLWPLVLLWVGLAPWALRRHQRRASA